MMSFSKPRFNRIRQVFFFSALVGAVWATESNHATAQAVAEPEMKQQQVEEPIAAPKFVDGEAQEVEAFKGKKNWIQHDLWVETEFDSDGNGTLDRVHVSVTRPKQTETQGLKVPVVYNTSPYFAGTAGNAKGTFWDPEHEIGETPPEHEHPTPIKHQSKRPVISTGHTRYWAARGFAVVHSCSPGTGLSQGCVTIGGENEELAPKAVIDWLNGRAKGFTAPEGGEEVLATWSTGKVGMTGTSYNGTLPIAAATTGVEGLEAIIPIAPNTSYYHYYRSNGLVRHPGGYMGEDVDVLYDFVNSGDPERREYCDCESRDKDIMANIDRETGDYSDWWAGRDYVRKLGKVKAATLIAHGLNDWNVMPAHSVRVYDVLKQQGVRSQIFLHQGGHGGPPPRSMQNRWFTRYLYGIENGVENDPKAQIVREGDKRENPTAYPQYPHPDAKLVSLFPNKGGLKVGALGLEKVADQGVETLTDDVGISGSKLAAKTESENRLLFVTDPLTQPVHISGYSKLKIRVSSDKPAVNLSVWLVSLPWDEDADSLNANLITRGWADPQNSKSLTESEPLEPGKFYDLEFDLQPDDQIIPVGQQIGLMIFSSDRDFTLWPDPGTKLSVDLDATELQIPVVGGEVK